jgi:hypothetical protein
VGANVLTAGTAAVEVAAFCWPLAEPTPQSAIARQHKPAIQYPMFLCFIDCFIVVSSVPEFVFVF